MSDRMRKAIKDTVYVLIIVIAILIIASLIVGGIVYGYGLVTMLALFLVIIFGVFIMSYYGG